MDSLINRRIYDSDDENWKEDRKKSLHDPMNLQKDSNKDSGKTSKSKIVRSSKHCCQAYIVSGLYFILILKLLLELVKILRNPICIKKL